MMKRVSISDLKRDFHKLLKDLQNNENLELIVTINNRPMAVIISWKRYRGLLESIALMSSPGALEKIKKSSKGAARDKSKLTAEELKKRLGIPLTEKEKRMLKKSEKDIRNGRFKNLL